MSSITVKLSQPKHRKKRGKVGVKQWEDTHTALKQWHSVGIENTGGLMWKEMNYHREEFGEILQKKLLEIMLEHINSNGKSRFWFWTQNQLKCVWITWPSSQIKTLIHCKWKFLLWKKTSLLTSSTANQNKCNVKMACWGSMLVCTQETDLLLQHKSITKIISGKFFSIVKLCHFRKTGKISSNIPFRQKRTFMRRT